MADPDIREQYLQQLAEDERNEIRPKLDEALQQLRSGLESPASGAPAFVEGDAEIQNALNLVRDKSRPDTERAFALSALEMELGRSDDVFTVALEILADSQDTLDIRRECFEAIQQASFHSPVYSERNADVLGTLRSIFDNESESAELRDQAARFLAMQQDETLQSRLIDGLENPGNAVLAPETALRYLSYDDHAVKPDLIRSLIQNPPNAESKAEAVRILAGEAESRELLIQLLSDKQEDPNVRNVCAVALRASAPEDFQAQAEQIVMDDDDDDELRATMLSGYALGQTKKTEQAGLETISLPTDDRAELFRQRVQELTGRSSDQLQKAIDLFLNR